MISIELNKGSKPILGILYLIKILFVRSKRKQNIIYKESALSYLFILLKK